MREETLSVIEHPTMLRLPTPGGVTLLTRFDHPSLRPVIDGAPDLGWEGDARLAFYFFGEVQKIILLRLESNDTYSTIGASREFSIPNGEMANGIIQRLISLDTRRGANVYDIVNANNAAADKAREDESTEHTSAMAEKLLWALRKDGA